MLPDTMTLYSSGFFVSHIIIASMFTSETLMPGYSSFAMS